MTQHEKTFSMFSRPESRGMQRGLGLSDPPPEPQALTEKYRPAWFAGIVGQGAAVLQLTQFVEKPYPTAFVFAGDTGTGKSTAALALANELGVNINWSLHRIDSGEMDQEAVTLAVKSLRFVSPGGGWKLVLCDEADSMSAKAKQMWLSALEDLSEKSVIVFTTNHLERFERRFLDRCEMVKFASDADTLMQDAQVLMNRLWTLEGIAGDPVDVRMLPELADKGAISFRRVVRAVEQAKLGRLAMRPAATVAVPKPARIKKAVDASTVSVSEKWRAAGLKAAQTRRENLARKEVTRGC